MTKDFLTIAFAALAVGGPLAAQSFIDPAPDSALAGVAAPSAPAYVPMSAHERWHGYLHQNLLGTDFAIGVAASALVLQASREPKEWGLGTHGYFHRAKDRFFAAGIKGAVHSSLAAALHQDTRYHRSGDRNGFRRAAHAVKRTFVTYNDSGNQVFDFSRMAGIYSGSMLSTYWRPHPSPLGAGVHAGDLGVMGEAVANLFKEFAPDLNHIFSHK